MQGADEVLQQCAASSKQLLLLAGVLQHSEAHSLLPSLPRGEHTSSQTAIMW